MTLALARILDRTSRIRIQLEREQRQPLPSASRLLRLQALFLQAQQRLAELIAPPKLRPVPVAVSARRPKSAEGGV